MRFLFQGSKKKRYARGFKWGKTEHKYEERTTRWLIVGILILCAGIYLEFWTEWPFAKYVFFLAILVFVICWLFRVIAAFAHRREKAAMDKLRFKRK